MRFVRSFWNYQGLHRKEEDGVSLDERMTLDDVGDITVSAEIAAPDWANYGELVVRLTADEVEAIAIAHDRWLKAYPPGSPKHNEALAKREQRRMQERHGL